MADTLIELADEDEARGRGFSASDKLERAALYLLVAERMQAQGSCRARGDLRTAPAQPSIAPPRSGASTASAWRSRLAQRHHARAVHARAGRGPHPVVVYCNGLDSCKELLYWSRLPEALARRGVSTLCVDQPGSGEALRLQELPVDPHSENWASKAVDWLEAAAATSTRSASA